MPMDWRMAHVPLAQGMQQKADPRAMEAPALDVCLNAEFDEVGGIQKRKPFSALTGTAPSTIRRLAVYDGELIAFTDTKIYSYSDANDEWIERSDYLATTVSESTVFTRMGEQTKCDRAELGGVIYYAWTEADDFVYVAGLDKETGTLLLAPQVVAGDSPTAQQPRLIALTSKVLLFYLEANVSLGGYDLKVRILDPTDPDTVGSATTVASSGSVYDVDQLDATNAVAVQSDGTGSGYTVATITEAASVATSSKSQTVSGPVAVAADITDGASILVVRTDGTDVKGDALDDDLTDRGTQDVTIGSVTGTTIDHVTAAVFHTTGSPGYNTFHVWWSHDETSSYNPGFWTHHNTMTVYDDATSHATGTEAEFVRRCGIASRAFIHDNRGYIWLVFAGESTSAGMAEPVGFPAQLQNTYFLYDEDGDLQAKAVAATAGGFQTSGQLPGVQSLGSDRYAWCGQIRRMIPLADAQSGYSARAPVDITFAFDDDDARRVQSLGATLYIAGGQLLQYDGTELVEVGFHVYPWYHEMAFTTASGEVESKPSPGLTYAYMRSWRWDNAKGERERSTTATTGTSLAAQASSTAGGFDLTGVVPLHTTRKAGVSVEIWRSEKNPIRSSPLHLVTDQDPDTSGTNGFLENDTTADTMGTFRDDLSDEDLRKREPWHEPDGILAHLAPPAATILAVTQDRLFLAGIANAPHRVVYSRLRGDSEIASFNDALFVDLPPDGGAITALAFLNETLVVFKERAIYMLPGDGFDNAGGGANYGPARLISTDVGAETAEGVAVTPDGIIFRSQKGWYMLTRSWAVEYIGDPVSDYDDDTLVAVHVLESQHQVRVVSTSRILVFDTLVKQWSEWEEASIVGSVIWGGRHVIATSSAVKRQATDHSAADYGLEVETAWIKTAGLQGFQRARSITVLGEDQGLEEMRVRVARDYKMSGGEPDWLDDKLWTPSPGTTGGPLQVKHKLSRQKCQAVKVRLRDGDTPASLDLEADSDQHVSIPKSTTNLFTFDEATWECWFQLDELPSSGETYTFFSRYVSSSEFEHLISLVNTGGTITLNFATGTVPFDEAATGSLSLSAGTWYHLAVVYDGSEAAADRIKIYLDGADQSASVTSGTIPSSLPSMSGSDEALTLGAAVDPDGTVTQPFDGKLYDVRIWEDARTSSEVSDNMSAPVDPGDNLIMNVYRTPRDSDLSGYTIIIGQVTEANTPSRRNGASFNEDDAAYNPTLGQGMKLTGLALEYGIKRGPMRLPAAQRQ